MQFHLNGFRRGDPHLKDSAVGLEDAPPGNVDVLIIGCGPAGLTLAAQLSTFAEITTRIVDQNTGPLELGQADGIACRTMEMFEAFGFSERVIREGYRVNETVFWNPAPDNPEHIRRSGRIKDVEDDLSEFPHMILNQARIHDMYLDLMRQSPRRLVPDYNRRFVDLSDDADSDTVRVRLEQVHGAGAGDVETVTARYVVGCDGARSSVRQAIGHSLEGDSANQVWGVMDVLAVTDFPDIRFKSVIRSASEGNIVIIPREGGYLVRLYIEIDELRKNERVADRQFASDRLVQAANRILSPWRLDVKEIVWWSVYEIGQRICDRFDNVPANETELRNPRVFIAGDACHTHSPKAGQGMNVSMADGFNLGWKLAAVIRGYSPPRLLRSYSAERHRIATELIEFDRHWAARFGESTRATDDPDGDAMDEQQFQNYFASHGRYTAGLSVRYPPSELISTGQHQSLATGLVIGERFHSAPVIRLADARPMQLGHAIKADGRWRLIVFAGPEDPASTGSSIWQLCEFLSTDPTSPVRAYQGRDVDIDLLVDVRAVFQQGHHELEINQMHPLLLPQKGVLDLQDTEKMFCPDLGAGRDIYDLRGINRDGCIVIVRPDQFVSAILPVTMSSALATFFETVFVSA